MAGFDISTIKRNDQIVIGAGVAFLVLSFLPWYHVEFFRTKFSENGWGLDGWCKLGIFLSIAATAFAVAHATGNLKSVQLPVGPHLIIAALASASALVLILRILTVDSGSGGGRSIPWFLAIIAVLVQAVFAVMQFRESGEALPGKPGTTPPPAAP